MHSIKRFFKLFFLVIVFIFLSAGYKFFGGDKDTEKNTLFDFEKANADVPPVVEGGAEGCGCPSPEGAGGGGGAESGK